jgi:dipeptidase E
MLRIVAIGGGEIGRPGYPVETTALDAEVVRLTGRRRPRVVFLPTATRDDPVYVATVNEHYGRRLGCDVEPLTLFDRSRTGPEIERLIAATDIVYVGGGNTLRMMKLWRRRGLDRLLACAAADGAVLAGVSAGAICWCAAGVSDSRSFTSTDGSWPYIAVRGLGLVDVLLAPHHDADPRRQDGLRRLVRTTRLVGIGLDDCTALEVVGDGYRILSCREDRIGHRVTRDGAEVDLPAHDDLRPLAALISRR